MDDQDSVFTAAEIAYLNSQRLGRLATVDARGAPQNNPVGVHLNADLGTIDVYGRNLSASRKYKNALHNPQVAMVVDDLVSTDPWVVRGIEIRGEAEAVGVPTALGTNEDVLRIHPRRVISWGLAAG